MAENRDEIIILTNISEVEVMLEEHTIKYINFDKLRNEEFDKYFTTASIAIVNEKAYHLFKNFDGFVFLKTNNLKTILPFKNTMIFPEQVFSLNMLVFLKLLERHAAEKTEKTNLFKFLSEAMENYEKEQKIVGELKNRETAIISILNHELKTPVSIIAGNLELMRKTDLAQDQKEYLRKIERNSKRLSETIDEILLFENLEDESDEEAEYIKFNEIINELIADYEEIALEKNLMIAIDIDKILATKFIGQTKKIRIIIRQLFSNAIKFTDGGKISLRIKVVEDLIDKQRLEIIVEDTGIGFSESKLAEYFEPFQQEEYYLVRKKEGLGLGLTIVNNLLKQIDGRLKVSSEVEKGSKFVVELCLDRADILEFVQFSDVKLLQVDDVLLNRTITRQILEPKGIQIDDAASGLEAIDKAKQNSYDLILMDNVMPEMDGLTASIEIAGANPKVPVVLVTASKNKVDLRKIENTNIVEVIEKNHTADYYVRMIKKYVAPEQWHITNEMPILKNHEIDFVRLYKTFDVKELYVRFNGNDMLIAKLIVGYLEVASEYSKHAEKYIVGLDEESKRYFHGLKGLSKSLCADNIARLLEKIENKEIEKVRFEGFYTAFDAKMKELSIELKDLLNYINVKNDSFDQDSQKLIEVDEQTIINKVKELQTELEYRNIRNIREITSYFGTVYNSDYDDALKNIKNKVNRYEYNKAIGQIKDLLSQYTNNSRKSQNL